MIGTEETAPELAVGDHVLVEAEQLGRSISFRTLILRSCPTELWLGFPSPDRRLETMQRNEPVRLTVARSDAALVGQSTFLRPLGGSKSRVFAVGRPEILGRVQRREFARYPIDLPVHVRHLDPATWEPRGKVSTTVTKDLSPGGLLFMSETAHNIGEDLDLTLPLSGLKRVSMGAVVKRLGNPAGGFAGPGGRSRYTEVAVKFTRITSLDKDQIVRLIALAEYRRREADRGRPQPASFD
jgi:c-di-GMP-binding flagellar brake protein YcgR